MKSTIVEQVLDMLDKNSDIGILEPCQITGNFLSVKVTGDWRHTHRYCDEIVTQFASTNGYSVDAIEDGASHDEDWYTSLHSYVFKKTK